MSKIKVNLQTQEGLREALSNATELLLKGEINAHDASVVSRMCETAIKSIEKSSDLDFNV